MFETITNVDHVTGGFFTRGSGFRTGFRLGVGVTEALGWSKSYSRHVPGMPPGFEVRHIPVVGPNIAAWASKMSPGRIKQYFTGMGDGATVAPTWTYEHGR